MNTQNYCDQCGAKIEAGNQFCGGCGQPLQVIEKTRAEVRRDEKQRAQIHPGGYMKQRIAWALIFGLLLIPVVLFIIWKDVGEFSMDVWLSLGVFIIFTTMLAIITLRKASGTWQGELFQIIPKAKGMQFTFITENGRCITIFGGSGLADYYKPGDRVVKIRGYDFPEKIDRDGERQLCVACGKIYPLHEKRCRYCRYPSIDPHNFI